VVVTAIVAVLLLRRSKQPVPDEIVSAHATSVEPFDPYNDAPPSPTSQPNATTHASTSSPSLPSTSQYPGRPFVFTTQQDSTPLSNADLVTPGPAAYAGNVSVHQTTSSSTQGGDSYRDADGALPRRPGPSSELSRSSSNQLTDEQATYVQTLYSLNVPAPAIAVVIERMLREGGTPAPVADGVDIKRLPTSSTSPPRYEDT
jgi:hypothetical protein